MVAINVTNAIAEGAEEGRRGEGDPQASAYHCAEKLRCDLRVDVFTRGFDEARA